MGIARPANLTIRTIITAFSEYLSGKAVDSPRLSADLICMHVLGVDRLALLTEPDRTVTEAQWLALQSLAERRGLGEPVAYLLGTREFYGRDFAVTPDTLIPRPETEHIIEELTARFKEFGPFRFADLGTGTGCIAVTLACELPNACGIAVDLSAGALAVANVNIRTHGVADRVMPVHGDFTTMLIAPRSLHCIASNPPYVSQIEYDALSNEVRGFEPHSALVPGHAGTEHARILIRNAADWLLPGGVFIMEMGYSQGAEVLAMFDDAPGTWRSQIIIRDLAGLDRHVLAVRTEE